MSNKKISTVSLHFEKHKYSSSINNLQKHNKRESKNYSNDKIDKNKSDENIILINNINNTYYQTIKNSVEKRHKARKMNNNSVGMVSATVQLNGLALENKEQTIDILKKSNLWLKKTFGENNVIFSSIHLDETNPHLHFDFMPIITKENKEQFNAKLILSRTNLQKYQKEFLNYLQTQYTELNFERKEKGLKGLSQKEFESVMSDIKIKESELKDLEKTTKKSLEISHFQKNNLEKEISILVEQRKNKITEIDDLRGQLEQERKNIDKTLQKEYNEQKQAFNEQLEQYKNKEIANLSFKINNLHKEVLSLEEQRKNKITEIDDLRGQLDAYKENTSKTIQKIKDEEIDAFNEQLGIIKKDFNFGVDNLLKEFESKSYYAREYKKIVDTMSFKITEQKNAAEIKINKIKDISNNSSMFNANSKLKEINNIIQNNDFVKGYDKITYNFNLSLKILSDNKKNDLNEKIEKYKKIHQNILEQKFKNVSKNLNEKIKKL